MKLSFSLPPKTIPIFVYSVFDVLFELLFHAFTSSTYWRSYVQLAKVYRSLGLKDKEEKLWLQLEKVKSLPYQQALEREGYFGFGYPSRIEVRFEDGDKIENWSYPEKDIAFTVINGEVEGEKEKELEQSEIETKTEESVPEEKDN